MKCYVTWVEFLKICYLQKILDEILKAYILLKWQQFCWLQKSIVYENMLCVLKILHLYALIVFIKMNYDQTISLYNVYFLS